MSRSLSQRLIKITLFFLSYIHICNYLTCNFILLSNCHITSFLIFFLTSSVGFNATLSGTDQFLIPFLNLNGFSALAVSYTLILFFIMSAIRGKIIKSTMIMFIVIPINKVSNPFSCLF